MLDHGRLISTDVFSYTVPGSPFLAFEWGSEILYAGAYRLGGLAGVAILAGLAIAVTYTLVVRFLLRRSVEPLLAYLTAMVSAMLGALHWVARPHLFTLLLVVVLLELLDRPSRPRLAWFGLLFALWANLHGGFTYGLVLIGLYLLGDVLEWKWGTGGPPALGQAKQRLATLGVAAAGACLTPNGLALYRHIGEYFSSPIIMNETQEFMSPDFHVFAGKFFLGVLLLIMTSLALIPWRPRAHHLLVLLANLAFSLISVRNIALFGITVLPLFCLHVDPAWRRLRILPGVRAAFAAESLARHRGLPSLIVAVLLLGLGAARGRVAGYQIVPDRFDASFFPVAAAARAREAGITGNVFSEFTWEGYLLHAWPEQRVFIDPGTDHYGAALAADYIRLWNVGSGWDRIVDRWRMETMILPPGSRLAYAVSRDPAWRAWYCDSVAVVLRRTPDASAQPTMTAGEPTCEPRR
jgi:hypothetical protein